MRNNSVRSSACVSDCRGLRLPSPFFWVLVSLCLVFAQATGGRRRRCRMPLCLVVLTLGVLSLLTPASSLGHDLASTKPIGIKERLGAIVPSDITLSDEQGRPMALGAIVRKPTILVLVYYTCSRFCPQTLAGLAAALPQLERMPDKDYRIITVSFDASDTPALAQDLKRNYRKAVQGPFPADAWRFLTGDRRNIERLCAAVGFTFRMETHGFAHPMALIILSPERRITRYIRVSKFFYGVEYPLRFSAIEVSQALADAAHERIGVSTGTGFLFCFPHEPTGQQRFFHILGIVGIGTVITLGAFFFYLLLSGGKKRKGKRT